MTTHRLPYDLSPAQELLLKKMIEASEPFRHFRVGDPRRRHDYLLGTLVQPAHALEGGRVLVPERHYEVEYAPGYGVVCPSLCTSNGSARIIAACVRDNTWWVPVNYDGLIDDRLELEG